MPLISFTKKGFYCAKADVYIDPTRAVAKSIITHGHSDHARRGMGSYLCAQPSIAILKERLGKINVGGLQYGETTMINGVKFSFHPAAHVLGSAQVRIEHRGEVWVISGDYKTEDDGISGAFEPVKCHHFVTETTFALPIFRWEDQHEVYTEINNWWSQNSLQNRPSVIQAYSLGKAQRIQAHLNREIGPVLTTPTVLRMNEAYRLAGSDPGMAGNIEEANDEEICRAIIISSGRSISEKLNPAFASASGWNMTASTARRGGKGMKFILSDHADWAGLNDTIDATSAENIYVTHGYESSMMKWLQARGLNAQTVHPEYE